MNRVRNMIGELLIRAALASATQYAVVDDKFDSSSRISRSMIGGTDCASYVWAAAPAVNGRHASSESKHVSFDAGIEEFDLEQSIHNGLGLPNELIEPLFRDGAVPVLVDIDAMSGAGRAAVE